MYFPDKLKGWEFWIMILCIILTWIGIYFFVPEGPHVKQSDMSFKGALGLSSMIIWIIIFGINALVKDKRNESKALILEEQIKDQDVKIYMEKQIDDLVKNRFIYIPKYMELYVHGSSEDNVRISERERCLERVFKNFGVDLHNPLHVQEALINWKDARIKKVIVDIDY